MLTCQKCGRDNDLGRIFCHHCGTKLDLSQVKPALKTKKSFGGPLAFLFGTTARRVIKVVILVLLIWAVYLMAQVPDNFSAMTSHQDLVAADNKRRAFETMVNARQPETLTVTQAELNAYLGLLKLDKSQGGAMRIEPKRIHTRFGDGVITVTCIGQLKVGDVFTKDMGISYTGKPTIERGAFVFKPVAGRVGELPIHSQIVKHVPFMQSFFERLFQNMTHERRLLGRLDSITVEETRAVLNYQPPTAAN